MEGNSDADAKKKKYNEDNGNVKRYNSCPNGSDDNVCWNNRSDGGDDVCWTN